MKDFFISYNNADKKIAEWIAFVLEEEDYSTVIQAWDFRPGGNFVLEMQEATAKAKRTIAVLSPDYLAAKYTQAEWAAAFAQDPTGEKGILLPVRVQPCELRGLLPQIIYIDLVGLPEDTAKDALLNGVKRERAKPTVRPGFQPIVEMPTGEIPDPAPLPTGSRMPLRHNPLFVGREEDLKMLARTLKVDGTAAIGQIAAATGLGGIGKTQLAGEFAHRYGQYFAGGVFWLSFAEAANVPTEIALCGGRTYLSLIPDFENLDIDTQVQLVQAEWQKEMLRLLVFDNCEAEDLLARWRPTTGGCRVLVTSRRGEWDPAMGVQPLSLDVLSRAESIELLRNFRPNLDETEADAIADELGDLPLALHLVGSYLKRYQRSVSPAAYLEQLKQPDLLKHRSLTGGRHSPTEHEQHVGKTFALSFDKLDSNDAIDKLALLLLARAGCFAPAEAIPADLLLDTLDVPEDNPDTVLRAEDALNRLIELGLLAEETEGLVLHRLLRAFVAQMNLDDTARSAVEQTISRELTGRKDAAGYIQPLPVLLPHLRSITDVAQKRGNETGSRLCIQLSYYLQQIGDYVRALPYLKRALVIHEQVLGPEHPSTATSLHNLALLLQTLGDYEAALPYLKRALVIHEQVLGPEHPSTATSLNNLGRLFQDQGDYESALPYLKRALVINEQALGSEHPSTATSLSNLGRLFQNQGDYDGALPYCQRALAIREQVLGRDHPDTAQSLNDLAGLLKDQGDYKSALPYYERALAIREQVLGPDHRNTAQSLNSLGLLLQEQGDYERALPYLERALVICEQVLGRYHPDTATVLNNLALLFHNQGDDERALPYLERALVINEQVFGPDHPSTAISLNNLAGLLYDQGDYERALPYYERALAICEARLGPNHPNTRTVRESLAMLKQNLPRPSQYQENTGGV